jgi:arylsulfatase A-like enzyme
MYYSENKMDPSKRPNLIWIFADQLRAQALGCNRDPTKHFDSVDKPWRGIVTEDGWRYVCLEGFEWLLFNLTEDPFEYVNLAHVRLYYNKRKELHGILSNWMKTTQDDFRLPELE